MQKHPVTEPMRLMTLQAIRAVLQFGGLLCGVHELGRSAENEDAILPGASLLRNLPDLPEFHEPVDAREHVP